MTATGPRLAGVMGWPIAHSRSPRLHGHWLKRYGVDGFYVPLGTRPQDFERAFQTLPKLGFQGVNVTLPFKETVLEYATSISDRAALIGAANTLTFRPDGVVAADNTDGYGFIENLRQQVPGWKATRGPALVIGAGGAARSVLSALLSDGAPEIRLVNRSRIRADILRDHFGKRIVPQDWNWKSDLVRDVALIVNATSLGMTGQPELSLNLSAAGPETLVTDIVYQPLETDLLRQARALGLRAVDGLGMLLHQAAPGFEQWFGVRPEVDADLRAAVLGE